MGKPPRAASLRKAGFKARILLAIGGALALLSMAYFWPPVFADRVHPHANDKAILLLMAWFLWAVMFATGGALSPARLRFSDSLGWLGGLLFVGWACWETASGPTKMGYWADAIGEKITGDIYFEYEGAWWHFIVLLFAVGLPLALTDKIKKARMRDDIEGWYIFVFVALVTWSHSMGSAFIERNVIIPTTDPDSREWQASAGFIITGVFLPAVLALALPMLLTLKEYLKEAPWYRQLFAMGKGGSARFGGVFSFVKYDFNRFVYRTAKHANAPIYGGRTTVEADPQIGTRHVGLNSDSMMLTVAAMGGGKSLYSAWNTLLLWRGGALVLDPKGEHADMTADHRRRFGKVHFLAPWTDRFEQATYNPLEEINLSHANARGDLMNVVEACIPREAGETANSKHFRENAQRILLGIMAHVLSEFGREYHNLPSIYDTILTGHPEGGAADPAAFDALVTQMAVNEAFGRAPMDAAKLLGSAGSNERGGFLTTLANGLSWANDEAIRPYITNSSFKMAELRQGKATVYVVIPFDKMSANARYMRVIVGAALMACREVSQHDESTLMLLDEFPQLGTFEPIKEGLVTLRSQKVKIWMMLQDIGQLKERYKNWQDFMSSCDKQFFAVNDDETAEVVQKALGEYVDRSQTPERTRPLRSLSEVREDLRKGSSIQYLLPADGNPLRLKLVPAYRNFTTIRKLG